MKTPAIWGIVVVAHCLAIGGIVLIQGCETLRGPDVAAEPVMPPTSVDPEPVLQPVVKPTITQWPSETTTYVVRAGDSLSVIAKRYNVSMSELAALNNISNKNIVRIGQKLVLPGKIDLGAAAAKSQKSAEAKAEAISSGKVYVVVSGDCLSVIASKYGVSSDAIKQANGMGSDRIIVGQKLNIPGGAVIKQDKDPVAVPSAAVTVGQSASDVSSHVVTQTADSVNPVASDSAEVAKQPVITETHVVQDGEDLRKISMQWLVSESKIREFNNLKGDTLTKGQVLYIPLSE